MSSKEKVLKILEGLSLNELCEAQSCINDLITRLEKNGATSQKKADDEARIPMERREQERFYEIFPCKLERADKQEEATFEGTVVDISKTGLRLKTNKKLEAGSVLVLSPDYDRIYKKIFVEVVRVKEFMGQYEIGVKHILINDNTKK
ncbi:MAG TPA: PilZ domain-containing protein [Candidatus Wunengus sp. YC60]|uniref:PilZ domain-containing protein n=1 Tax=Candidatus Wunengus sp. YC60 TaxID=3367697 RepID=UPI004029B571